MSGELVHVVGLDILKFRVSPRRLTKVKDSKYLGNTRVGLASPRLLCHTRGFSSKHELIHKLRVLVEVAVVGGGRLSR